MGYEGQIEGPRSIGETIERALMCQEPERALFLDHALRDQHHLRGEVQSIVDLASIDDETRSSENAVEIARRYRAMVPDAGAGTPPMTLFLRYLDRTDAGETVDLETLCTAHPEAAADLRAVSERWVEFRSALKPGTAKPQDPAECSARDLLQLICAQTHTGRRYTEVRPLGKGGMGRVAEVLDLRLGRSVAKKTPNNDGPESFSTVRRLLQEARITAHLEHPGIVPVHELGIGPDGTPYFTMRVVHGITLGQAIQSCHAGALDRVAAPHARWTRESLLATLQKVCDTIAYAHSRRVIHRDLKPDNVLLGQFGEAYVMDWGLAYDQSTPVDSTGRAPAPARSNPPSHADGDGIESIGDGIDRLLGTPYHTHFEDIVGTPCYMPPEQAAGTGRAPVPAFDVYSLGAILYQILTGATPYAGPTGQRVTARQAMERLRRGPPRPIADLSPNTPDELIAICDKAMARSPGARYLTVVELRDDLTAFLEGRVVRAHRTDARVIARKWAARNPTFATSLIALLLVSTTLAFVMFAYERETSRATDEIAHEQKASAEAKAREAESRADAVAAEARADLARAHREVELAKLDRARRDNRFFSDAGILADAVATFQSFRDGGQAGLPELSRLQQTVKSLLASIAEIDAHLTTLDQEGARTQHAALTAHRANVLALSGESKSALCISLVESLIRRASWSAETLPAEELTLWSTVHAELAADDRFLGVDVPIQPDLVPLGRDRDSGLQEFALKGLMADDSRWLPTRGDDGLLTIEESSTIVLVLLPPAARKLAIAYPALVPPATSTRPVDVQLNAYMVGKYELTHAQLFSMGAEIAREDPNADGPRPPRPAVNVTSRRLSIPLARFGFRLPNPYEWENAARGDHEGPLPCEVQEISQHANFYGMENAEGPNATSSRDAFDGTTLALNLTDGRKRVGPITAFAPNSFGLYNVLGNAAEFCLDDRGGYYALGGSFRRPYFELCYSARRPIAANAPQGDVGVRVVRPLNPLPTQPGTAAEPAPSRPQAIDAGPETGLLPDTDIPPQRKNVRPFATRPPVDLRREAARARTLTEGAEDDGSDGLDQRGEASGERAARGDGSDGRPKDGA